MTQDAWGLADFDEGLRRRGDALADESGAIGVVADFAGRFVLIHSSVFGFVFTVIDFGDVNSLLFTSRAARCVRGPRQENS